MARNEEKQLARLNRFYLQRDKEEYLKKNPPRPKLDSLTSASAIQKWLPSIKRDLDFYIKQSMVPCYPESTIQQFSLRIDSLKREYKSFILRLREFDPHLRETPWTDRPYAGQKRESSQVNTDDVTEETTDTNLKEEMCSKKPKCTFKPLSAPILDNDSSLKSMYGYLDSPPIHNTVAKDLENQPLNFSHQDIDSKNTDLEKQLTPLDSFRTGSCNVVSTNLEDRLQHIQYFEPVCSWNKDLQSDKHTEREGSVNSHLSVVTGQYMGNCHFSTKQSCDSSPGVQSSPRSVYQSLNLPYSDSEDSSDS